MEFIEVSPQSFEQIESWSDINHISAKRRAKKEARKAKRAAKGGGFIKRLAKSKVAALATGGMSKLGQKGTLKKLAKSKLLAVATGGVSRLPAPRAMKKRQLRIKSVTGVGTVAVEPALRPDVQIVQADEVPQIMETPEETIPEIMEQPETPEIEPDAGTPVLYPMDEPPQIDGGIMSDAGEVPEYNPDENIPGDDEGEYYTDNVTKVGKFLRKAAKSKVLAIATGGVSKLGSKAGRQEVKKVAKAVGKVAGAIALAPALAPLLPLVPVMKAALKKKGLPVPKGLLALANSFYNNIVKKSKSSYDYDDIDLMEEDHIAPAIIAAVVTGIIKWIKDAKAKKAAKQKLSPIEQVVADGAEKVQTQLEEKAKDEAAGAVGKRLLFDKKTQLIIGGVLLLIIGVTIWIVRTRK